MVGYRFIESCSPVSELMGVYYMEAYNILYDNNGIMVQ